MILKLVSSNCGNIFLVYSASSDFLPLNGPRWTPIIIGLGIQMKQSDRLGERLCTCMVFMRVSRPVLTVYVPFVPAFGFWFIPLFPNYLSHAISQSIQNLRDPAHGSSSFSSLTELDCGQCLETVRDEGPGVQREMAIDGQGQVPGFAYNKRCNHVKL